MRAHHLLQLRLLLLSTNVALCAFTFPADSSTASNPELLRKQFNEMLNQTSSPEFERLLQQHRDVVKRGYANVSIDALHDDSLSAIISFIKYKLQKTFSLTRTQLIRVIPIPTQVVAVPITFDYPNGFIVIETGQNNIYRRVADTIVTDPWEKEAR